MALIVVTGLALAALVAERRRALEALEQRAAELARSNADLEEFAQIASHDLKAPLRGVSSLARWVAEDCEDMLPDEAREQLKLVDERATRMSRLIDGILAYSRVGRTRCVSERVDPRAVVEEVIDLLGSPESVSIRIEGALPAVRYDRTQLLQVFQNLIGNAVQHLGKPSGEVVVSCRERDEDFEFSVRDDGVGIAERHFARIFKMFQTLNSRGETTGIGLAIVKKIVEAHGGSISVESTPGAGSTFGFSVPRPARRGRG
jgi:signal transduction histidine kinase